MCSSKVLHNSFIGSETPKLSSARSDAVLRCGTGATTFTLGKPSACRIRHTCVVLSLDSSSHKSSGCTGLDEASQKAMVDAVQYETCIEQWMMEIPARKLFKALLPEHSGIKPVVLQLSFLKRLVDPERISFLYSRRSAMEDIRVLASRLSRAAWTRFSTTCLTIS